MNATCVDCAAAAVFGLFDGVRGISYVCAPCAAARALGPVPDCGLGPDWIIGHAAQTNHVFGTARHPDGEMFRSGSFREIPPLVVLGVNHQSCLCNCPGRSPTEPIETLIDWDRSFAATSNGSLVLAEDLFGLFFAARVPLGAWVAFGDATPIVPYNLHTTIADGRYLGLSLHHHGGDRVVGPSTPSQQFVWARVQVCEISLLLGPTCGPASPGTWAMPAGPAAMEMLYTRLRESVATAGPA